MKVIFLDHDGVICLPKQWGSREKKRLELINKENITELDKINIKVDDFDKLAVDILNEIIKETECEIVVSSDWKYTLTLEEMGKYYESKGILKKPINYTEPFNYKEYIEYRISQENQGYSHTPEEYRAYEIHKYLEKHPEITHWVAIDDLDMRYYSWYDEDIIVPWGIKNMILTIYNEGLKQTGLKDKILKYLI